jgi:hypothetical protein
MRKQIFSLITTCVLFIAPFTALAQTAHTTPLPPLLAQIKQAKALLEPVKLNYSLTPQYKTVKKKKVLSGYMLDIKDLAVAVLDPATGEIKITAAMQRGTDFTFPDKNFDIQKTRFNGVNTRFVVNKPAGGKVLALKYLITPIESGLKAEIEKALYTGIYVPYSPELLSDELSVAGANYLDGVIKQASLQLANKPSVSQPGKTIPEAIKPQLVRALIYAEHMDTTEFLVNSDTNQLVKKINVLLAGNEGDTWKYSVSSAGAAGISQFIPSTYGSLVKRHPDAALIPDFVTGMRNHVNAVKSTFILLDDYIKAVQDRAPDYFLAGHAFDYGVAAYNGGPARVAKAATQFGATWYEDQSAKLKPLQEKVSLQAAVVSSLRAQIKKITNKTEKAKVQKVLAAEEATLKEVTAERDNTESAILRNETVNYVLKIHRLIQVFNDTEQQKVVAAR